MIKNTLMVALAFSMLLAGCVQDSQQKSNSTATATPLAVIENFTPPIITAPTTGSFVSGKTEIRVKHVRPYTLEYTLDGGANWINASRTGQNASKGNIDTTTLPDGTRLLIKAIDSINKTRYSIAADVVVDNTLPFAFCENNRTAYEGGLAGLNASESTDALSGVSRFDWDLDGDAAYDDATGSYAYIQVTKPGIAHTTASVNVTDRAGNSNFYYCNVYSRNVEPNVTLKVIGNATEGEPVELRGGFYDPGQALGANYTTRWDFGNGETQAGNTTAFPTYVSIANYTTYNATFYVSDGLVEKSKSTIVNVSNFKPVVTDVYGFGQDVRYFIIQWKVHHPYGVTLFSRAEYYDNNTGQSPPHRWMPICFIRGTPYQCTWDLKPLGKGSYAFRVVVSDGIDQTIAYANQNISVSPIPGGGH